MTKKKVALDAGHCLYTPGKRTPDDEREWAFNNAVLLAAKAELAKYPDVEVIRLDDPTGKRDVPLDERTDKANKANADVLVSIHHNANTGKWGLWTGIETFVYEHGSANSTRLAEAVHPRIVKAMGLKDRGIKKENFHMVRESTMPAILTEGGYMDSSIDIKALRNDAKLKAQGVALATGIAAYLKVSKPAAPEPIKPVSKPKPVVPKPKPEEVEYMLEKAIIINTDVDYPAARPLSQRLKCPIYVSKSAYPANASREVIVIGADKSGIKAGKVISLEGKDRFDTFALVNKFIDAL